MACARSACGRGCGKRFVRAMASPAAVSSALRFRTMPITVFANRVTGLPGFWVAVMFNHLVCAGAGGAGPGRPVGLGLRPIVPAHHYPPVELRLRGLLTGC